MTISLFLEIPEDLHDRLMQHIAANPDRYPDNDCRCTAMDQSVRRAIELLLAQEEQLESGRALLRKMYQGRA